MPVPLRSLAVAVAAFQNCQGAPPVLPVADVAISCANPTCDSVILDATGSTGRNARFQWYERGQPTSQADRIVVSRILLQDEAGMRLRVSTPLGVDWLEIHDLEGGIIDQPDPVSPFVVLKDGTCQIGSIAYDPTSAPVGGCLLSSDVLGLRWLHGTGGSLTKNAAMLHVPSTNPYAYEQVPMGTAVTPSTYTIAAGSPQTPVSVFTTRDVGFGLIETAPPASVSPWSPPPPLYDPYSPPAAHFSIWVHIDPGETFLGQWFHGDLSASSPSMTSYLGLPIEPKSARFEVACPGDIEVRTSTLTTPNLPAFRKLSVQDDLDGDGYSSSTDCDDFDATIHPGALEVPCDGIDSDCSGTDDFDEDGDGVIAAICGGTDCDDTSASTAPGQAEIVGNQVDDDCDGRTDETCTDGTYDRIVPFDHTALQDALDTAQPGDRICVEPGAYVGDILVPAKGLHIFGAQPESQPTLLVGSGTQTVVRFDEAVTEATIFEGFEITGGVGQYGGGLAVDGSRPTLRDLSLYDNAADLGGGLFVDIHQGTLQLDHITVNDNRATHGGGLYLRGQGQIVLRDLTVLQNEAEEQGGGASVVGLAGFQATRARVEGNVSLIEGGGLHLEQLAQADIQASTFLDNTAAQHGGGLWTRDIATLRLQHNTFVSNEAGLGAGLWLHERDPSIPCSDSETTILHALVIAHNRSATGYGGAVVGTSQATLTSHDACVTISDSLFWDNGAPVHMPGYIGTFVEEPPQFASFHPNLPAHRRDLHFSPASPLTWGATTGPLAADPAWYDDQDNDGLFDGWEAMHGLDTQHDDADEDPDSDGLTNIEEAWLGTWPSSADTDEGGHPDGLERDAATQPLDPFDD